MPYSRSAELREKSEKKEKSIASDHKSNYTQTTLADQIRARDLKERGPHPLTVKGTDAADFLNQLEERNKTRAWLRGSRDKIYGPLVGKVRECYTKVGQLARENPNVLGGEEFVQYLAKSLDHFKSHPDSSEVSEDNNELFKVGSLHDSGKTSEDKDKTVKRAAVHLARLQAFQWKLEHPDAKAEGKARGRLNLEEAIKQLKQTGDFVGAYRAAWAIYDDAMAAKQVNSILFGTPHTDLLLGEPSSSKSKSGAASETDHMQISSVTEDQKEFKSLFTNFKSQIEKVVSHLEGKSKVDDHKH